MASKSSFNKYLKPYKSIIDNTENLEIRVFNDTKFLGRTNNNNNMFVGVHEDIYNIYHDESLTRKQRGKKIKRYIQDNNLRFLTDENLIIDFDGIAMKFNWVNTF